MSKTLKTPYDENKSRLIFLPGVHALGQLSKGSKSPNIRFAFGRTILDELYGGIRCSDINELFDARLSMDANNLNSEIFRHIRGYPSYTISTEGPGLWNI